MKYGPMLVTEFFPALTTNPDVSLALGVGGS